MFAQGVEDEAFHLLRLSDEARLPVGRVEALPVGDDHVDVRAVLRLLLS